MDDTQQSRVSDAAAAATRKRRSSILKSQRPPRAPFSELEFNVATPTDTSKSRRVSFSRRNGVAEFVTNEATTTWKNFYEEHNKSLESSGNDSGAKPRPSVGHVKRIFDEQFQEVDASHFIEVNPCTSEESINNINYVDEETNRNIEAPNKKYEMSMFTDHSNVFGNDMGTSGNGEMTDKISLNFSVPVKINDDLEAMERDLENQFQAGNVVGPAFGNKDMSEYIEFDLNTTHVASKDQSDMSITDTILSPKVQAVQAKADNNSADKDWIADKENIAVNPYVAPQETENFAINEDEDKVLVFDGKRLTIQTEKHNETQNKSISEVPKQRKNIVLNVHDDLPNFVDNPFASMSHKSIVFDDLSIDKSAIDNDNKTIHNDDMDVSMTQCVSGVNQMGARHSVGDNISMTQGVPNVLIDHNTDRRKTVVFEDYEGNISITQAVSQNVLLTDSMKSLKKQTIVFETNGGDVSVTQIVLDQPEEETPQHDYNNTFGDKETGKENTGSNDDIKIKDKRKTIVYTADEGDISITQAIPNIIIPNNKDKRQTIVFHDDSADISMTQAIPSNIVTKDTNEKRKTIIFEENADISVTQAIPANIIQGNIEKEYDFDDNMSFTQAIPNFRKDTTPEKRKTILFDRSNADISMTQAIPNIIMNENKTNKDKTLEEIKPNEKIKSILFDMTNADMSMDLGIPNPVMGLSQIKDSDCNVTISTKDKQTDKRKTILFDNTKADVSVTQAIPNVIVQDTLSNADRVSPNKDTRQSIVFDWNTVDIPNMQKTQNGTINKDISMDQTAHNDDKRIHINQSIKETAPDNVLTDVKEEITGSSNKGSKLKHNKVPNIPSWLRSKACEATNDSLRVTDLIPSDSLIKSTTNEVDSIILTEETAHESIIRIPKSVVYIEERNIENKIQRMLSHDSDSISSGSSSNNTQSHKPITACESMSSLSDANYVSEAKLVNTSEASFQAVSDIFYDTKSLADKSSANLNAKESNEFIKHAEDVMKDKPLIQYDKDVLSKTARPIPSEILAVQDIISNKSAIDDILKLKSEVSFERVPNTVFVYQNETKPPNNSRIDSDSNTQSNSFIKDEAKTESNDNYKPKSPTAPNTSMKLLTNLLDMSNASSEVKQLDKMVSVDIEKAEKRVKNTPPGSNDDLFFVTPDDEVVIQTDTREPSPIRDIIERSKSFRSEEDDSMIGLKVNLDLLKKIAQESATVKDTKQIEYKPSEDISTEIIIDDNIKEFIEPHNSERETKVKHADSTTELLDMLSEFTDIEERDNPVNLIKPVNSHVHFDLTKRQSMSRQEFFDNISLAKAMLETTDVDDSIETASACISTEDKPTNNKCSAGVSTDVVKTLKFDEASFTETGEVEIQINSQDMKVDSQFDTLLSPLRKPIYSNESQSLSKSKVIPQYWHDHIDDIKDLMNDLVKPNADALPFDTQVAKDENNPSTSSIEVQANLFTSSQIDLTDQPEVVKYYPQPMETMEENVVSKDSPTKPKLKFSERSVVFLKKDSSREDSIIQSNEIEVRNEEKQVQEPPVKKHHSPKKIHSPKNVPEPVITFDHSNPLNNILLTPIDKCVAHKYEPMKRDHKRGSHSPNREDSRLSPVRNITIKDKKDHNVSQQYAVTYERKQFSSESDTTGAQASIPSVGSLDQHTDAFVPDVKDTEVNTVIVMKTNAELLKTTSSLTLVDSVMSDINYVSNCKSPQSGFSNKSPLTVIYKQKKKFDTDSENAIIDVNLKKREKRPHSSTTGKGSESPSNSPITKVQKQTTQQVIKTIIGLHTSPVKHYNIESPTRDEPTKENYNLHNTSKIKKIGTSITVQQVITEYNLDKLGKFGEGLISSLKKDFSESESHNSSDSGKQRCVCNNKRVCTCDSRLTSMRGQGLAMDWQPELLNEISSKNLIADGDDTVNVIDKINMLPFMGTQDCEWESASHEKWSFRLLHGRLRLAVKLGARPGNTDTVVRADTPVRGVTLTTVGHEKHNVIALLCVKFASQAVRYAISVGSGGVVANDNARDGETDDKLAECTVACIPAVLRASAGVARVALRWGRAMRDARGQLAYRLTSGGQLALKVANIPLRSVWEVTMRLEMTAEELSEPWPRAGDVVVTPVVAQCKVTQEEIDKVLANVRRDWGHAPRTLWKVFRHLKRKKKDDLSSLDKY